MKARLLAGIFFVSMLLLPRAGFAAAPHITSQPLSTNVLAGSNATFKVTATGSGTLVYRWSFNGTNLTNSTHISDATATTLTVNNITASDAGNYRVVVTNNQGSATSSIATLTVLFRPSITSQPQSQTTYFGATAVFSVTAGGTGPLKYQWRFGGTLLSDGGQFTGSATNALNIANVQPANIGNYQVIVTNNYGAITSSVAALNATNRTHYVNVANTNPVAPYMDWITAATNIQDAVDACVAGDSVLVTNGIYASGSRVISGMTNCVVVTNLISLMSVSGPAQTIIDGGGAKRCVYLINGVWLSGFTLMNGNTTGRGGGASCEPTTVLTNCVLTGNGAGDEGGAVNGGTLFNCTLTGNSCTFGGAAANSKLSNCTVTGNYGGYGGGAAWVTMDNCVVNNNTSWSIGGGVASGTLNNCTLIGNICDQHGGAAVYSTLTNCILASNSSQTYEGGGVDSSTLSGCTLSNNTAGQWGGNAALSTLSHCVLTGGSAGMGGGAKDSTLNDCTLSNNGGYVGGGANGCNMSNCTLVANSALSNGGGAAGSGLINCLVVSNSAPQGGGVSGSTLTNCVIQGNTMNDPYFGGGAGAFGSILYNCLVAGNSSMLGAGGASQCTLVNCTVTGNSANGDGGGVDSSALTNCIVYFNNSPINQNYSGTNYMSWCCTMPLPTAGPGDTIIGVSNVSSAPVFADAAHGNYRLYPGSPGIDVGNNSVAVGTNDLDGNLRIVNGTVDLGAYEFQNSPFIEIQPVSQTVPFGQPSVSFSVFAVGPGTLTYQWRFNGTNVIGATNSSLTLNFVQYSQAGNYSVVVANSFGSTLSSNAVLTVVPPTPPSFATQPAGQIVPMGTNVKLTASATGAPPPAYRWYFNGAALFDNSHYTGTATGTLLISNVLTNDTGNYFAVATNTGGSMTSSVAAVTVLIPPTITLQPASQTLPHGSNATFNAVASGGTPLSYQWWFNPGGPGGTPLADGGQFSGSTTTNLTISNIQFTNGGNYVLVVTNPVGSAASTAAVLKVIAPPAIVQQPADQSSQWGASAIFSVVAIGSAPLNYQWTLNGSNLNGATNAVLALNNVQPSQAGIYAVTITNVIGSVVSSNAVLTVNLPPPGVPFITGFSPATAFPGATVTIFGTNFSPVAGSNIVYFGAVQAAVLSASATNLVVTVPVGATYASITETVNGLTAYASQPFEPTFPGAGVGINSSSFGPRLDLPSGSGPIKAVIADLDNDGKPDLIVANDYNNTISLYRNISTNGLLTAGSFAPRVDLVTPPGQYSPFGMVVADVDGDGRPDIIVSDYNNSLVSVYHNTCTPGNISSNLFATRVDFATGAQPQGVEVRDIDGDGMPDLLVANAGDGTVSILRNTGAVGTLTTNSFAPKVDFVTGAGCQSVVVGDLDGDGLPDLVTSDSGPSTVSLLRNLGSPGNIAFAPKVDFVVPSAPVQMALGDLDGDGKPDLTVASYLSQSLSVFRNISTAGSLTTNSFASRIDYPLAGRGHTPVLADLDGDGKPDLSVVTELSSMLSVFQNASSPGSFTNSSLAPRVDFGTGYNAWGVSAGDLDGDGRPDIVFCNSYDNNISIYQNQSAYGGAPIIIAQSGNQIVPLNNTAQLSGTVMGQSPLSYQWYFSAGGPGGTPLVDDGRITGSTTGSLSISNALLSDSGNYWFVVTNSLGSATSTVAAVTVIIVPPAFAQEPQNQAAILGSNAVFSANVSGSLPMAFQWFTNGNGGPGGPPLSDGGEFSGSATTALTISGVQTNDAVNYWLVASNAAGIATSSVVNLTVVLPVVITQQPSSQTNAVGSTFALIVAAGGSGPFGYQWYFGGPGGTPLADNSRVTGSATGNLSISNAQTSDTGSYTVVVTNLLTAATSSVATVTVLVPPSITTQPLGRSTPLGLTNIFAAAASGAAPLLYQWRLNGTNIPGATNTSYFIAATGTNDLGIYQFVASNAVGFAVSSNVLLTVGPVAAWGYNSFNQCLVPPGLSNVTTVAGGYDFSLVSRLDGSIVAWGTGAGKMTNSTFTNVLAVAASYNSAVGLRADGSVTGSGNLIPSQFNTSLSNAVAIAAGYSFGLALRAEGTVVTWGYNPGLSGNGGNASTPPGLTHVTAISSGFQHNLALKQDSTVAAWGIGPGTNVPVGLSNVVAIAAGSTHSLALKSDGTLVAWGTGAGTNIPAGLSSVMTIAAATYLLDQRSSVSFAVKSNGTVVAWGLPGFLGLTNPPSGLTNVVAVASSVYHALALVNDGSPQIIRQPAGGVAWSGRDWTLQAVAAGAALLNYQWLLNGTNVPGATNASLLLPVITSGNAGSYQVVVSNSLGVATSLAAPLTVMDSRPFFLTQPTNLSVYLGSKLALSTAVAGSGPLQLQWLFNSNNIPGATNDTLNFDRVHLANAGSYTLVASNSFGAVTSAVINLTVQQLVVWGGNINNATNMPPGLTNVAAISANFYGNIALRQDGTVTIWGDSGLVTTNTAAGISNVVEVSAGNNFYLALKSNGQPYVWGYNLLSAFSNAVVNQSNIVAVEAGNIGCALLKNDGSVVWINFGGVVTGGPVSSWTNVISVEPFDDGVIALRADGTVSSVNGGSPPPSTLTNVLAISSARYQGLVVKRDGSIQDWSQMLLPAGTSNIIAVAAGGQNAGPEFAVRADGSIMTGGSAITTNVPYGLAKVWCLDAGNNHCLALLSDRDFPPVFLHKALDTSSYVVSSKGAPQWFGQANISHDGVSAAQSAPIGINLSSSMRMWVAGLAQVKFWWKVSSATNHGVLSFSAGGVVLTNISGEVDWQQCTLAIPPGNQILQWTYAKDGAAAAGQDAAWVDQLQVTNNLPPTILVQPQPASQDVLGGTNVAYNVTVIGTPPLTYFWKKDLNTVAVGLNKTNLLLTNVTRHDSGSYSVFVMSPYGNATSSNAVLKVHVPQLLGTPVFQPDGSIVLSSIDATGNWLVSADLANFQVQVSTNLVDWMTLSNALVLINGGIQLQDADAANSPMRFYRIVENW